MMHSRLKQKKEAPRVMDIELEENVQSPNAKDADPDIDQSNQAELKSLVPLSFANNEKNANRQKMNIQSGSDHINDRAVGVPSKHSGIPGATMNFVNSIIGAGIIGLPSALNKSGFIFGIFLMIVVALMVDYGVRHLIECGLKVRKHSYEEVMQNVFGNRGFYFSSLAIFGFAYGAMIVYHIVIGDTIPKIFQTLYPESILCNRSLVVALYSIIFMLPLSLLKNMASLEKTSTISFLCVIFIVFAVTIEGARVSPYNDLSGLQSKHLIINEEWFAGAGTMAFAFVCHHSSFVVYKSLQNNTQKRWNKTTHSALTISVFFSMWLAIAGFVCFQTGTKGDILNNFKFDNTFINIARGFLALTMVFTYPMELFVARLSVLQCLKEIKKVNAENENIWFYVVTLMLWSSSLLIGAFVSDIGIVLEINGVLCGATVGFILPGLVSLRVFGWNTLQNKMIEAFKGNDQSFKTKYTAGWNFLFPIFMIAFGTVVMLMGLTEIFLNL